MDKSSNHGAFPPVTWEWASPSSCLHSAATKHELDSSRKTTQDAHHAHKYTIISLVLWRWRGVCKSVIGTHRSFAFVLMYTKNETRR
jgi:hypothetical protein